MDINDREKCNVIVWACWMAHHYHGNKTWTRFWRGCAANSHLRPPKWHRPTSSQSWTPWLMQACVSLWFLYSLIQSMWRFNSVITIISLENSICHTIEIEGSENRWGCATGCWKLDQKKSRETWNFGQKRSNSSRIGSFLVSQKMFWCWWWVKVPQKDRVPSPGCQKGDQNRSTSISPNIEGVPSPGAHSTLPGLGDISYPSKPTDSVVVNQQIPM